MDCDVVRMASVFDWPRRLQGTSQHCTGATCRLGTRSWRKGQVWRMTGSFRAKTLFSAETERSLDSREKFEW